jgi:5-methylcytosine-specific restriction endonuclease McrA
MSLKAIGDESGLHLTTVAYWCRKHGICAANSERFAPKGRLKREQLEALVNDGLSLREIAEQLDRSVSTIVKWMARYGLKTHRARLWELPDGERPEFIMRECATHGLTKYARTGTGGHYRCLQCRAERVVRRRRRIKEILVHEAGGACQLCGYNRWLGALQFHHLNPSEKEFHIARRGIARSLERVRAEARKCVLLCANCHAEVEGGAATLPVTFAPP